MRVLLLCFLCAASSAAQIRNPVINGDRFDISGSVLDSVTAKPIPGAQITLQPAAANGTVRSTKTGSGGNFQLLNVPLGVYNMSATSPGYAQGDAAFSKVILVSGTQPDHYSLTLVPQATLSGTVSDDSGKPIPKAQVTLLRSQITNGQRRLDPRQTANTNNQGIYRFEGLGPGECYVHVSAPQTPADEQAHLAFPPTFFPNVNDAASAPAIKLNPGMEQQADVTLARAPAFQVRGAVNSAVASLNIALVAAEDPTARIAVMTNAAYDPKTAKFQLPGVTNGTYILAAAYRDRSNREYTAYRLITIDNSDLKDINLSLSAGPSLTGTATVDGVESASQVITSIQLESRFGSVPVRVDRNHLSVESTIPPGTYRLVTELRPNWFVQAATQGGRDVLHGNITVSDDGAALPLQLALSSHSAILQTTVIWPDTGHRVPAHVTVLQQNGGQMLVMAEHQVDPPGDTEVNRQGIISGLPAGQYVVYAWPEPVNVEYADPEALHIWDPFAQQVSIDEGQQVRTTLKLAMQ